jgi:alpha-galactosidase
VRPTSATTATALATGRSLRTGWHLTAPAGTPTGSYGLTLQAHYRSPSGQRVTSTLPLTASVVLPPPSGTSYLSDLPWLSATSGWGPVERDTSNGESAAGDGNPLTVGGVTYAKGLGVHALSELSFYTGKACEKVTADVGVDDEKGAKGTVAFEIWADGTKAASTGVLTNAQPAQPVTADVSGAQVVRLVVSDGGDGVDSDHADWADARLSC